MKTSPEGRKPVTRRLPALKKACAAFTGFKEGEQRTERIAEVLSTVIQRCRRSEPLPFYAMRDVAEFFGVSLGTVARVYRQLSREGALTLVRSSQTMITPRSHRPKFALRGVVYMPIWMPGFLHFRDWRRFFSQLEDEFSRHRFVLEAIFYRLHESSYPAFVDRVLKFNPDYVLWNAPALGDRPALLSIGDAGVPLVVINDSAHQFPGRVYRVSYVRALRQGLQEWKASGEIDRVVVPQWGVEVSLTKIIKPALKESALPHRFELWEANDPNRLTLEEYLKRLAPSPRTGIIFDDDLFYIHLCLRRPEAMFALFRRHRVMVMREAIAPHDPIPTDVTVDAILPNRRLARQIATDLSKGQGQLPDAGPAFEAEWRPGIPLKEVVQSHLAE